MILSQVKHFSKYTYFLPSENFWIVSKHFLRHFQSANKSPTYLIQSTLSPILFRCLSSCPKTVEMAQAGLSLEYVVEKLNSFAPKSLAESWDNVGLLIQPATPTPITSVLLTNDLTEAVMQEALDLSVNMIISYHPPIFMPLKSVTSKTWKERIVAKCLENRIAVYSPHTSFDAIEGGVNCWLTTAFDTEWVKPIIQTYQPGNYLMEIIVPLSESAETALESFRLHLRKSVAVGGDEPVISNIVKTSCSSTIIQITCAKSSLPVYEQVYCACFNAEEGYQIRTTKYEELRMDGYGMGRLCQLKTPLPVSEIVNLVKKHVDMSHLQLALAVDKTMESVVSTIAVCAGSGSSVLKKTRADLFLTGEMSHHDVLEAIHQGTHVILTNHSNSERGYLTCFATLLSNKILNGKVTVLVSKKDSDPLKTV